MPCFQRASCKQVSLRYPFCGGGHRTSASHALQGGNAQKRGRGYSPHLAMLRHQKPHWAIPPAWLGLSGENSEKFLQDPGNALRAFPGIPVKSTAGIPQTLLFKAFEASRTFPEFSPPQYGWGCLFFQKWFRRGPLRAGHGIPSSTEGISDP